MEKSLPLNYHIFDIRGHPWFIISFYYGLEWLVELNSLLDSSEKLVKCYLSVAKYKVFNFIWQPLIQIRITDLCHGGGYFTAPDVHSFFWW